MDIWSGDTDASQTTEDRATQLLSSIQFKLSHATIWDLTEDFWEVGVHINEGKYGDTYFYEDRGDDDWKRIEQLLDLSDDELVARCDEWLTQEVEDCGEEDFSAEEVGKQDEEEDAEEGGYQVIGGARSGTPKVVHP